MKETASSQTAGNSNLPTIGLVGPMLGQHPGWVVSQGEVLAARFREAGYQVKLTSSRINPFLRVLDILVSLLRWRRQLDVAIVLVFSQRAFAVADAASWLLRRLGIPQVLALHGGLLPEFAARHPRWVRRVLDRADAVVSPSGYLAEKFRRWGYEVGVIPNVFPLEDYPYRSPGSMRPPRLMWMRTFHPLYNPAMAVRVLERVRQEEPGTLLTMAGQDKGELDATRELAAQLGLGGVVRFPGFLDLAGKKAEMSVHDVFLNTNHTDNTPVSVLEAAAVGLPVVATEVAGIPYLLQNDHSALLVPDGDVEAMASAVLRLVREPELAQQLSRAGRDVAERCAWPGVQSTWQATFDGLGVQPGQERRE